MATVETTADSSSALERDARLVSADPHGVSPGEIALGVVIGRTSEAFDFFVYGIASVLVFPAVVFPFVNPLTGTLYSFAIFGLAFVARPIGSVIFMAVDRRHGRGVKLTIALFLLGGSTASISFLPSYGDIGSWSIVMLVVCRIGQGLALGGAWDGLASLLALNAPQNRRGWYAMVPQLGAPFGFIVASGLFAFFLLNALAGGLSCRGAGVTRSSSPSRSTSWRCLRGCASWRPSSSPSSWKNATWCRPPSRF